MRALTLKNPGQDPLLLVESVQDPVISANQY